MINPDDIARSYFAAQAAQAPTLKLLPKALLERKAMHCYRGLSGKVTLCSALEHKQIIKFYGDEAAALIWLADQPDRDPSGSYRLFDIAADAARMVRQNREAQS